MKFNIPKDMEVPEKRKEINDHNVLWLIRNLGVRNSDHPEFKNTMKQLKELEKVHKIEERHGGTQ